MNLETFIASLSSDNPPAGLSTVLTALWVDAKGDWDQAHQLAQSEDDSAGAWVHAYLHRKEGDPSNAAYWYRRAGKSMSLQTPEEEWKSIVDSLLQQDNPPA